MRLLTVMFALLAGLLGLTALQLRIELAAQSERLGAAMEELNAQRAGATPFGSTPASDIRQSHTRAATVEAISTPASARSSSAKPTGARKAVDQEHIDAGHAHWREVQRRMNSDPKTGALIQTTTKAALRSSNPELAKYLGLDAAEEDALLDLLARQAVELGSIGESMSPEDARPVHKATEAKHRAELVAQLGTQRHQAYEGYLRLTPELKQIAELRNRTAQVDALTDDQTRALAAAMQEERMRYAEDLGTQAWAGTVYPGYPAVVDIQVDSPDQAVGAAERKIEMSRVFYDQIIQRASGILSPAQLQRFDELATEWHTQEQLRARWLRANVDARTAGENSP